MATTFKTTKYLRFDIVQETAKTKVIFIININHDEVIGEIKWFSRWRQYCFFPNHSTAWNIDCLNAVNLVITELMDERKPQGRIIGVVANSMQDFQEWRKTNYPVAIIRDTVRKFEFNGDTYICLSNVSHCCGWSFDEITETPNASNNRFEYKIIESARAALKPKGIWYGLQR